MKKNQEQWINEVMESLQGIKPADGNPYLHTRVMTRVKMNPARQPVQVKWVFAVASVFVVMLVLNVLGWSWNNNSSTVDDMETVGIETVINDYQLENSLSSLP